MTTHNLFFGSRDRKHHPDLLASPSLVPRGGMYASRKAQVERVRV